MPGVDWLPGVSQIKSLCQLVTGDVEGAKKTQQNFYQECPVVSQTVAGVQYFTGYEDEAEETFKKGVGTLNSVANGLPVVGHVKGVIHHIAGDAEGGDQALNAASRSSVVLISGAVAGMTTGGIGAIPAGIAAGSTYDITHSLISDKPKGVVAAVSNVLDKPSAGSVIDAAAIFVGDGIGGHAGGKLGANVVKQVKVGRLEAVRDAKYAAMEEAGTSGEALSIGKEINTLTSEINNLQQGTPKYWSDPKASDFVAKKDGSVIAPNVVPNKQWKRRNSLEELYCLAEIYEEDGFGADWYPGVAEVALSPEQLKFVKEKYKNQKPNAQPIDESAKYRNVKFQNQNEPGQMKTEFDRNNDPKRNQNKNKNKRSLADENWLHLRMPPEFGYTGAIMSNRYSQGLLHTFVRHSNQWREQIPDINSLIERLPISIQRRLEAICKVENNEAIAKKEIKKLINELENMDDETLNDIRLAFYQAQWKIYESLQANVTSEQYLEEGFKTSQKDEDVEDMQVYFKVKDKDGNVQVMVVCMSRQLFLPIPQFRDAREVRTVTTVFFLSWDEYQRSKIRSGKMWF